jgi:hypothetical protein
MAAGVKKRNIMVKELEARAIVVDGAIQRRGHRLMVPVD